MEPELHDALYPSLHPLQLPVQCRELLVQHLFGRKGRWARLFLLFERRGFLIRSLLAHTQERLHPLSDIPDGSRRALLQLAQFLDPLVELAELLIAALLNCGDSLIRLLFNLLDDGGRAQLRWLRPSTARCKAFVRS